MSDARTVGDRRPVVLILAPFFLTLARKHASAIDGPGAEAWVVSTAAQGPRQIRPVPGVREDLLGHRLKDPTWPVAVLRLAWHVRRARPAVALLDDSWDFRFHALARLVGRSIVVVHDAVPHDDAHGLTRWKHRARDRARRRAHVLACFSAHVETQLRSLGFSRIVRIPLTSELAWTEEGTPSAEPTTVTFAGSDSVYKGLDRLVEAWPLVDAGGRDLMILGPQLPNASRGPASIRARSGWFSDAELVRTLSGSACVVLPYRAASQSGIQLAAAQLGVPTVVTRVGGLPEMQTEPGFVVEPDDVAALAAAITACLAAGSAAERRRRLSAEYAREHGFDAVQAALGAVLGLP